MPFKSKIRKTYSGHVSSLKCKSLYRKQKETKTQNENAGLCRHCMGLSFPSFVAVAFFSIKRLVFNFQIKLQSPNKSLYSSNAYHSNRPSCLSPLPSRTAASLSHCSKYPFKNAQNLPPPLHTLPLPLNSKPHGQKHSPSAPHPLIYRHSPTVILSFS